MAILSIVMSGLALLAAAAAICIAVTERKRNQKRNATLVNYIDSSVSGCNEAIKRLEDGVVPDYEQAKRAADAVNDFNKGISSILGFDPYESYKRERQKEKNGGETE